MQTHKARVRSRACDAHPGAVRADVREVAPLLFCSFLHPWACPAPSAVPPVDSCAPCRFYYYNSYKDFHPYLIGATALYLASKVEEHPVTPKAICQANQANIQVNCRRFAVASKTGGWSRSGTIARRQCHWVRIDAQGVSGPCQRPIDPTIGTKQRPIPWLARAHASRRQAACASLLRRAPNAVRLQ